MSSSGKLFGRNPSVNKFRPFGCLVRDFKHERTRKKLDSKSILCILLATLEHGYYRVFDLAAKKVYVSHDTACRVLGNRVSRVHHDH
jgi:hypothetical protein